MTSEKSTTSFWGLLLTVSSNIFRVFRILLLVGIILGALFAAAYVLKQDDRVRTQFEGKRWSLPARVFARPLDLYEGQTLFANDLEKELHLLRYRKTSKPVATGQYSRKGNFFKIHTRGFQFAEDVEQERLISISISKGRIRSLKNLSSKTPLNLMRLEPILIGNFYPYHNEDRVLVRLTEVPPLLTEGLVAVEDKNFYNHLGINPTSILRALIANVQEGRKVQGGSTLTQQLVKNYFLTNEQSYKRKANEATMSMLLELHYSKDELLEAYMNEIYLGQNGQRAIHGFGLASQFYFGIPLRELSVDQVALLIGMAKGASYYNPRRFPNRALQRRNLVLDIMAREGVMSTEQVAQAKQRPLGVSKSRPSSTNPFPAYLELVKLQLRRDYQEEDLHNEGLLIFTAMDPIVQLQAEDVLRNRVRKLERGERIPKGKLNGAMVISNVQNGEIQAIVGGREPRYAGYNRAIDARRQIGSVIKPAVYLAALEHSNKFNMSTRISDAPVVVKVGREYWKPRNYDHRDMGGVLFSKSLILSRNTPTVRIGIQTGLDKVIDTIHDLGIHSEIPPYPSILLGTSELAPIEVQQMFQTLASDGTYTPLQAIRSVMDSYGNTLKRYPLNVKQVASPENVYQITYAMNQITRNGTAKYLSKVLPAWKSSAGKTGTTNDKKDSWYAGFTGKHVITVWVGRDDNKPTNLTGGSGALKVWADMIRVLPTRPFKPVTPKNVRWVKIDKDSGLLYNPACGTSVSLPFSAKTMPKRKRKCSVPVVPSSGDRPTWQRPSSPKPAQDQDRPVWQGFGQ
ncbi:MAG: Multimodular transpeptidase-transglycosylase (EC (EC [uncultured Thiotrichaceae bacterium]|uniref:Penicillin-binding protein 1B n=1 Tax=uncultured Thiotrichaceae bacterium TaxID=298394 RepID=A0A6S6UGD0_9GAMM|nr:MAG: Multimodular transpeptidase-transglycosylase (EC (EC [uncultured Thiotrichaceae bacterium]